MRAVRIASVVFICIVSVLVCVSSIITMIAASASPGGFVFGLAAFIAASMILVGTLRQDKDVRWAAWLLVIVVGGPSLLGFWGSYYVPEPAMGFTAPEDADARSIADEFLRPTREEHLQTIETQRTTYAIVVAALVLQLMAVIYLRREGIKANA